MNLNDLIYEVSKVYNGYDLNDELKKTVENWMGKELYTKTGVMAEFDIVFNNGMIYIADIKFLDRWN